MQTRRIGKRGNVRVILLDTLLRRPEAPGVLTVEGIGEAFDVERLALCPVELFR
jgi:hypothetical protein